MTETNTTELAAVKAATLAPLSIKETVLAQFKEAEGTLQALADRYRNVVYDVKTPKGMKEAVAARADLRDNGRLFLTRAETRIKGEVNDLKRVMATEVERLVAIVEPVEHAVNQQIKAEEQRKAAEKAERERIEAERIAKHRANIDKLKGYVERAKGQPIVSIEKAIEVLSGLPIGPEYEEFETEAKAARDGTVNALRAMVEAERDRIQKEQEAARVAAELAAAKAELEAMRKQKADEMAAFAGQQAEARAEVASKAAEAEQKPTEQADLQWSPDELKTLRESAAPAVKFNTIPVTETLRQHGEDEEAADEKPTLKLGELNARLGFIVTADFLAGLGFEATVDRNARLYRESQFPAICAAIAQHVMKAAKETAAA